jgi:glycosyltransferase involved in cell wall biosynthesis
LRLVNCDASNTSTVDAPCGAHRACTDQQASVSEDFMQLPRLLFFLSSLPRDTVSVRAISEGSEAVSGSHTSSLLVAEGLAARGHQVGVVIQGGQTLTGSAVRLFTDLDQGLRWSGETGRVVWCSWGDEDSLVTLRAAGARPWMWLHTGMIPQFIRWLECEEIAGVVTVSDSARLPSLHSSGYRRIGRAYNPLNPLFERSPDRRDAPRAPRRMIFAGYLGESKGAHRVLQMWPHVREQLPDATLVVAGSGRLYGDKHALGPLGVAAPDFEARYLQPLVDKYGSLEASGIRMAGLVTPGALRDLYAGSALGIANLNWDGHTETFCCSAVEMLATSLPVFSVARGALPETVGRSGGAFLMENPDLRVAASEVVGLLRDPERLQAAGQLGSRYVRTRYTLEVVLDHWEKLLSGEAHELDARTGPWAFHRDLRYWAELACGRLRLGRSFEACVTAGRAVRDFARQRTWRPAG